MIKRILFHPIFLYVLVPVVLILFWIASSIILFEKPYFLSIYPGSYSNLTQWSTKELLKGQKIAGNFIATQNNLGIVDVRFYNFAHISQDSVIFRIKEARSRMWYYQNSYTVAQFQPNDYFTFGFPLIPNSKGKQYNFEIESLHGKHNDAIALSTVSPPFSTVYAISTARLKRDPIYATSFILNKIGQVFAEQKIFNQSLIYLLPLLIYGVLLLFFSPVAISYFKQIPGIDLIAKNQQAWLVAEIPLIFLIFVFLNIYLFHFQALPEIIFFYIIWYAIIRITKFGSSISLCLAGIFLIPTLIFSTLKQEIAQQFNLWFDIFCIVGIFELLYDELIKKSQTISIHDVISKLK